jgi:hypothetical protein
MMTNGLQPITLTYKGRDYTVDKDDSIWGLIEAVESVIPFLELAPCLESGKLPSAKIFRAYTAALNYAGAKTTPMEVKAQAGWKNLGEYAGALAAILMMAQPSADLDLGDPTSEPTKKKKQRKSSKRAIKSG